MHSGMQAAPTPPAASAASPTGSEPSTSAPRLAASIAHSPSREHNATAVGPGRSPEAAAEHADAIEKHASQRYLARAPTIVDAKSTEPFAKPGGDPQSTGRQTGTEPLQRPLDRQRLSGLVTVKPSKQLYSTTAPMAKRSPSADKEALRL
jgi:hypothetical protein